MANSKTYINWELSDNKKDACIEAKGATFDLLVGVRSIFNNYVVQLAKDLDANPLSAMNLVLDFLLEDKNFDAIIEAVNQVD